MNEQPTTPLTPTRSSRVSSIVARVLTACMLVAVPAAATGETKDSAAAKPQLTAVQYYEDLEDGKRHNVVADLKGDPERVSAKAGTVKAQGRLSGHIGPGGQVKSWFFRDKAFVKQVLAEFAADGTAAIKIKATNDSGTVRELCLLQLEAGDANFGNFAEGECEKL